MQIGFCLYKYFPYGGIQRDLMKLARECLKRGHEVRVYVGLWNAPRPAEQIELVLVPAKAVTNHKRYERFASWVGEHLREHPVDLLVGMNKMPGLDVYYAGDSCYAEKARTQRGALYRMLPRYRHFARFERAVFGSGSATEILTISDNEVPVFREHYATPLERFHALPPGIDRDRAATPDAPRQRAEFRREFVIGDAERVLLFVGSGFIKKGLDRALLAVRALPEEVAASTRLFVVGNDNAEPFRRMAARLGISSRVQFFSGRDDIPRFLHAADALLLPAYDETAGMVIIEAMIAGVPALVTANCGYAGYLAEANAGLLAPLPFDQAAFNGQLLELLTSPERERWRANGRALAANPEIYRLAEVAVDFLERFAAARQGSRLGAATPAGEVGNG
jgi:UDP-glucose:(heptosyl)LPS alpha-1,3-glucosyltransferase